MPIKAQMFGWREMMCLDLYRVLNLYSYTLVRRHSMRRHITCVVDDDDDGKIQLLQEISTVVNRCQALCK